MSVKRGKDELAVPCANLLDILASLFLYLRPSCFLMAATIPVRHLLVGIGRTIVGLPNRPADEDPFPCLERRSSIRGPSLESALFTKEQYDNFVYCCNTAGSMDPEMVYQVSVTVMVFQPSPGGKLRSNGSEAQAYGSASQARNEMLASGAASRLRLDLRHEMAMTEQGDDPSRCRRALEPSALACDPRIPSKKRILAVRAPGIGV